jgi:hypothetical protein
MANEFDFGAVNAQVTEYLNKENSTPAPVSTPAAVSAPVETPPAPVSRPSGEAPAVAATPAPVSDKPVVDGIDVEFEPGKVQRLTRQEIKDGWLRQADYTKKTTEAAEMRKQAEAVMARGQQMEAEREQLRQVLSNPQALMYLAQQQLAEAQGPQYDPNAPVNMGQVSQLAEYNAQQLQAHLQQMELNSQALAEEAKQAAVQEVTNRLETAKYTESINATLSDVYKEYPILKSVPEMEDIIRFRVAQSKPADIAEANKAFIRIGAEVAKSVKESFAAVNKEQVIAKTNLVNGGIEPPGGAAVPSVAPQPYRDAKSNTIDWARLRQGAEAYVSGNKQ